MPTGGLQEEQQRRTHDGRQDNESSIDASNPSTPTPDAHAMQVAERPGGAQNGEPETIGALNESVASSDLSSKTQHLNLRRLSETPDVVRFATPEVCKDGSSTFIYEFSSTVVIRLNPLYRPCRGFDTDDLPTTTTVTASCPRRKDIQLSLSEEDSGQVQRISPTRLVYPGVDIGAPQAKGKGSSKVRLPLPMTLEELYWGATKEAVVTRTRHTKGGMKTEEIVLSLHVEAGMLAGQEIQADTGQSAQVACFIIYESFVENARTFTWLR
ncbi:hypothetical protein BJY04DRAFT_214117 [Aspergillus karnatakaensis]|uniref:uncharacterized protein n=1 Tax=Aspergillus karnatakaensis TaxID=1810916 RepID=UPI003CCDDE30